MPMLDGYMLLCIGVRVMNSMQVIGGSVRSVL